MKTIIKSVFAAIVATLALAACSKEVAAPVEKNAENLIEVTLIAGNPEAQPATKTEMNGTTPYWSVGDKIGVTDGSSTDQYLFSTGITSPATTASFSGSSISGDLYAYYPYTTNGVTDAGKAKVDIPINQYPTASSFDGSADVMVAKQFTVNPANTTVSNLEFARLGAIVKIVLIDKESTMTGTQHPTTVSMTAESNLVGRVYVDMPKQELGDLYYNQSKTVTANYIAETKYSIDGTNATYLIVYPQTLAESSTLTISASTEDYSIEKVITVPSGGIELLPGKINTLNINLLASHITASAGAALPFNDNMAWADNGASDASTDISSSISTQSGGLYTAGTKAYKGIGGLKLGTSSATGSITTKELDLSGAFNIAVKGKAYGSDGGNLVVSIDGTEVLNEAFASVNYVNIPAGSYTKKSKVTIGTSTKRGYLYSVKIKSGSYVADPVITVTSSNPMDVANTASSQTIEYTIANPTAASLSAALQDPLDTWISSIDCSTDGEVTFNVAAQESGASARSAVIVLSYTDADDVEVTVNQAAGDGGTTDYTVTWTATAAANLGSTISTVNGTASGNISTTCATPSLSYSWDYTRTLKSGTDYMGYAASYGIQLGKNGGVENIVFSTSNIPGTIKSVSIECSSYGAGHKVSISVDGTEYLASTTTASGQSPSTLTGTGTSSGEIVINVTDGTRYVCIKSISVTYNK